MMNGTGSIAQSATARTSTSSSADGAALAGADTEPMSSTGAGDSDNDQAGTPSEDSVSERTAAGATTPKQSSSGSHGGPEAQPPSTRALVRTGSSAASPAGAVANGPGQPRGADGVSTQAATGVVTLTQSDPRRSSRAGTGDQVARLPDPAEDPRWEAVLRAVGVRPPITREEPEGNRDAPVLALAVIDGSTPADTRQTTTMVRESSLHSRRSRDRGNR